MPSPPNSICCKTVPHGPSGNVNKPARLNNPHEKAPLSVSPLAASVGWSHDAFSQELALFGKVPDLGKDWVLSKQGSSDEHQLYACSWIIFTNSKTGDLLSFVADRYHGANRTVTSSPVRQAAIETIPGGYPRQMEPDKRPNWLLEDTIRSNVVQLDVTDGVGAAQRRVKQEALEYTYIYKDESKASPNRLAHGYVLAFGDVVVFVQHTSTHAITSELANDTALSLISTGAKRNAVTNGASATSARKRDKLTLNIPAYLINFPRIICARSGDTSSSSSHAARAAFHIFLSSPGAFAPGQRGPRRSWNRVPACAGRHRSPPGSYCPADRHWRDFPKPGGLPELARSRAGVLSQPRRIFSWPWWTVPSPVHASGFSSRRAIDLRNASAASVHSLLHGQHPAQGHPSWRRRGEISNELLEFCLSLG